MVFIGPMMTILTSGIGENGLHQAYDDHIDPKELGRMVFIAR